jgi:hypothetical protein
MYHARTAVLTNHNASRVSCHVCYHVDSHGFTFSLRLSFPSPSLHFHRFRADARAARVFQFKYGNNYVRTSAPCD